LINSVTFRIFDFSENIFLISLKEKNKTPNLTDFFFSLSEHLRTSKKWIEVVSGEDSLIIKYNISDFTNTNAKKILENQLAEFTYQEQQKVTSIFEVPICYSEEFGLDIQNLKVEKDLTIQEIVGLHSSVTYKVKMIGFTPGFAYLGDLQSKLFVTRLSKPRVNLVPGSVGISGNRTGIYTLGGPGGWRIIGRTPLSLFKQKKKNPFAILPGMEVKFKPITTEEFESFSS